jgi:hypothetical protein
VTFKGSQVKYHPKPKNMPVYTFYLSVTTTTLDRSAQSKPNINVFSQTKGCYENGQDRSILFFPENFEKPSFLTVITF